MTFTITFGTDKKKDTKQQDTKHYPAIDDNVVFSCNNNDGETHCTYSTTPEHHDSNSPVKGGFVGDAFQLDITW